MSKDSFWFPFEPNRWLSNEKLSLVSLEARGLWIHLMCLMYKANSNGSLVIGGNIPTKEQITRMVGQESGHLVDELQKAGVFEIKDGAIHHQGVAQGLNKINSKMEAYRRRDGAKMDDLSFKDEPSIDQRWGENKNKSKSKIIHTERAIRPSLLEWSEYATSIGWYGDSVEGAYDHYQSNGWKVGGKGHVKDWQAAARNCFRRNKDTKTTHQQKGTQTMKPKLQYKSSCESAPLYRVMGFASFNEWQKAGEPTS